MCNSLPMHYQRFFHRKAFKMFPIVAFWAFAASQAMTTSAQVAVPVVSSQSSQYFAQTHNALASTLVQPVVQYIAPSGASVSQVTRYAQYLIAPYVLPGPVITSPAVAPLVATNPVATPVPAPQQPSNNPDAEAVEVESARLRAAPVKQAVRSQQPLRAQNLQQVQNNGKAVPLEKQQSAAPGFLSAQQFVQNPYLG